MEPDIRDLDVLRLWRDRPGHIARIPKLAVVVACAVTLAITAVGSNLLWSYCHQDEDRAPWWLYAPTLVVAGMLVVSAARPSPLSRVVKIAVILPVAHALALLSMWAAWHAKTADLSRSFITSPMVELIPIPVAAIGVAVIYAGLARWIAHGRRGEAIHTFVMLALWMLLLFGLWLPIANPLWYGSTRWMVIESGHLLCITAFVIGPPLALATGLTALGIRRPRLARRLRPWTSCLVTVLCMTTLMTPKGRADNAYVYSNFVHVLLAAAFVAIAALIGLGGVTWWRARRARAGFAARAALAGTIAIDDDDDDDDPIGCFEVTSWLRGPRMRLRGFTLVTAAGRMVIHGGAQLVVPLPLATTQLRIGESLVALRAGDPVVIAGLEIAGDADPYRARNAPVGSGGLLVASARQDYGFAHIALTMWRPCLAYLMILILVGIPSLLAAVALT